MLGNPAFNQIGIESNDRLGVTGYQTNYHNAQVFDSYRFGSDLSLVIIILG